jgi:hypothetical protein
MYKKTSKPHKTAEKCLKLANISDFIREKLRAKIALKAIALECRKMCKEKTPMILVKINFSRVDDWTSGMFQDCIFSYLPWRQFYRKESRNWQRS